MSKLPSHVSSARPGTQTKQGLLRTATVVETAAGVNKEIAVSPYSLVQSLSTLVPHATETVAGIAEIATQAETNTGTDDARIVTPLKLKTNLASPPAIGGTAPNAGAFTGLTSTGITTLASGAGVAAKLGNSTGTLGFFGATGATKVTQGAITNSVTAGGSTGTIANYTDLSVYANDATAIRNDIYQLSLALANVVSALRSYGLLV